MTGNINLLHAVPSSPPLNFMGEAVDSWSIYLTWHPPEPSDRNGIITGYFIQVVEVDTNSYFSFNRTNNTEFLLQQLHPYYSYNCSIAAFTAIGRGPLSSSLLVQTDEDGEYNYAYSVYLLSYVKSCGFVRCADQSYVILLYCWVKRSNFYNYRKCVGQSIIPYS